VHGVKAQQVRVGLNWREIVDGNYRNVLTIALDDGPQNIAADTAKSVDGDPDRNADCSLASINGAW